MQIYNLTLLLFYLILKKEDSEFFNVGDIEDFEDVGEDFFYSGNAYEIFFADFFVGEFVVNVLHQESALTFVQVIV